MLPYSREVWFDTIARMNADLFLFMPIALLLGLFLVALTWQPGLAAHKPPHAIAIRTGLALAAGWMASGALFYGHYLEVNSPTLDALRIAFIAQGGLLAIVALWQPLLDRSVATPGVWAGRILMLYALLGMPLLDLLFGPGWLAFRLIGLAPEPTVVFTCGWLLTRQPDGRVALLALLPAAAGIAAGYAALALPWPPDWIVPLAALAALVLPLVHRLADGQSAG